MPLGIAQSMARIRIKQEQLEILRTKADLCYEMMSAAIQTSNVQEQACRYQAVQTLAEYDLGRCLKELTLQATEDFMTLNKGGNRVSKIEEAILHYVLLAQPKVPSRRNYQLVMKPGSPSIPNWGGLRALLDANDTRTSEEGELFRRIQHTAQQLREENKHPQILSALVYVRFTKRWVPHMDGTS